MHRLLKGEEEDRGPLTADEIERITAQAQEYIADPNPEAMMSFGGSMLFINAAFRALKQAARGHLLVAAKGHGSVPVEKVLAPPASAASQTVQQLTEQVTSRCEDWVLTTACIPTFPSQSPSK